MAVKDVKCSKVSKLDGILSWSLPAVYTCPGARGNDGSLVEVCQGCYARFGNYRFPAVKNVREHNKQDWQRDDWVDDMVAKLDNERYFRWFDSGDVYHYNLAVKMYEVIRRTPWCQHWIPTRSHKIPHIRVALEMIKTLPNASVRYSSDTIGEYDPDTHGAVVVKPDAIPDGVTVCRAYENPEPRCNGCRACWDKNVATIAYVAHGQQMNKVIRRKEAATEAA